MVAVVEVDLVVDCLNWRLRRHQAVVQVRERPRFQVAHRHLAQERARRAGLPRQEGRKI